MNRKGSALNRLRDAGIPDPNRDLRKLFDWAFQGVAEDEWEMAQHCWDIFDEAVEKRIRRMPVSQIIGRRAFWRHEFQITGDVLDPRPETELLVEWALSEPFARVLDLGTGSGAVVISLLADRPAAQGQGTDISPAALEVAAQNAQAIGVADRLALTRSDWFQEIGGDYDLIVSNPPYISAAEMDCLEPEVRVHEPRAALTDEGDGLSAYRAIAAGAPAHLRPGGRLLVEIGHTQGAEVADMFIRAGFDTVIVHPDLNGRDRVVSAKKPVDNRRS